MYTVCYRCGVVSDTPLCRNCLARGYTKDIPKDRIIGGDEPVERTGIGSDFKAGDDYYEVKTGDNARLSPRQREEKRRRGDNLHEVEYDEDLDY